MVLGVLPDASAFFGVAYSRGCRFLLYALGKERDSDWYLPLAILNIRKAASYLFVFQEILAIWANVIILQPQ